MDYSNNGNLRHEPLVESVLSTDVQREQIDLWLPVRGRCPTRTGRPDERTTCRRRKSGGGVTAVDEIPMDRFEPVLNPCGLPNPGRRSIPHKQRRLSTEIEVASRAG